MRVILVAKPQQDISGLEKYGEIVQLLNGERYSIFKPDEFNTLLDKRMDEIGFDPENDMIALTGNVAQLCLFMLYLGSAYCGSYESEHEQEYRRIKVLIYSSVESDYALREVTI